MLFICIRCEKYLLASRRFFRIREGSSGKESVFIMLRPFPGPSWRRGNLKKISVARVHSNSAILKNCCFALVPTYKAIPVPLSFIIFKSFISACLYSFYLYQQYWHSQKIHYKKHGATCVGWFVSRHRWIIGLHLDTIYTYGLKHRLRPDDTISVLSAEHK